MWLRPSLSGVPLLPEGTFVCFSFSRLQDGGGRRGGNGWRVVLRRDKNPARGFQSIVFNSERVLQSQSFITILILFYSIRFYFFLLGFVCKNQHYLKDRPLSF